MKIVFLLCLLLPLLFEHAAAPGISIPSNVSCGDGLDPINTIIHSKDNANILLASELPDTSDNYCLNLTEVAHRYWEDDKQESYKKANDTLRLFIEQCSSNHYIDSYGEPWMAFPEISQDVKGMDSANERWLEYRDWLKKVLYFNMDPNYYCADAEEMFTTFQYVVPDKGIDYNGIVALVDYLIAANKCPESNGFLIKRRAAVRDKQKVIWQHGDTTQSLDTSAVSIDSIGFSILRGPEFGAVNPHTFHSDNFAELTASKNPFTDETILQTTLTEAAMLKLEIYDVLGKQLYSENQFFSSGEVKWKLDGKLLPQGSLYARVSMIGGLPKTIKLVKE